MPTSVISRNKTCNSKPGSPRTSRNRLHRPAGFTLLEMVVVLAIIGLIVGIAAVRVFNLINSWRARTELDSIGQQFAHLPVLARQRGRAIVLPPKADPDPADATLPPAVTLPANWLIRFDHPLTVRASGLCEGATITLEHYDRRYYRRIDPPFCQWQATEAPP